MRGKNRFKFGKKDNLVSEEAQGNAASMSESKRARMHFNFSLHAWAAMTEKEKNWYISLLPSLKERSGGETMGDTQGISRNYRREMRYNKKAKDDLFAAIMRESSWRRRN